MDSPGTPNKLLKQRTFTKQRSATTFDLAMRSPVARAKSTPNLCDPEPKSLPEQILEFVCEYKDQLGVLLEHLCRPLMDAVENNKVVEDLIASRRFYNEWNLKRLDASDSKKGKSGKSSANGKSKKKRKTPKGKSKSKSKRKKPKLSASDHAAKATLNSLFKLQWGHKSLLLLFMCLERICGQLNLLHAELELIIFAKHADGAAPNYEDSMLLDAFALRGSEHANFARIGRLLILYTDLFSMHVEYAARFPECLGLVLTDGAKDPLADLVKRAASRMASDPEAPYALRELLEAPLAFPRGM